MVPSCRARGSRTASLAPIGARARTVLTGLLARQWRIFRGLRRLLAQQLPPDARVPGGAHGPRLVVVRLGHAGQRLDHALLGKGHNHLGAVAEPALELEGAVMQLRQALGDGKPESGAALGALLGERALAEAF